ncbi:MAG: hypothetical protein K8S23_17105 [Candidatus Cloacimonetes bacterium]|nr:hypothetical protein [Candidatus Cloacimonadota bacterium]
MTIFSKINFLLILLTLLVFSFAQASFIIPNHVYEVSQLKAAQQKAKSNRKPITFIYSDKNTDCGLATEASKDVFQGLKKYSIIVYVELNDWKNLPAIVRYGINSTESGKYIPKTIIVDSDFKKIICILPYVKNSQRTKLIKQAQAIILRQ